MWHFCDVKRIYCFLLLVLVISAISGIVVVNAQDESQPVNNSPSSEPAEEPALEPTDKTANQPAEKNTDDKPITSEELDFIKEEIFRRQNLGVSSDRVRYFNKTIFEQKYSLRQSGTARILNVQLFSSIDGAHWSLRGEDKRLEGRLAGRLDFKLPGDGRYGIKTVTTDEAGNTYDTWDHDAERMVFVIDLHNPGIKLSVHPDEGSDLAPESMILLQWEITDQNLKEYPVTLQYTTDPNTDKWQDLGVNLTAKGARNYWVPKREGYRKPYRLLFRVIAFDRAGNESIEPLPMGYRIIQDNIGMPPDDHQKVIQAADGYPDKPVDPRPERFKDIINRVNRSNFEIEYSLQNVGTSGIKYIELWYTPDYGRTWKYYGRDQDKKSPIFFTAPDDGVYGFYLIVENNAGYRLGKRPASGMRPPEKSVTLVDTAAPFVQLISPRGGEYWKSWERNFVEYKAFDNNLARIDLYVSFDAGKNWELHTRGLKNTGKFRLPTDDQRGKFHSKNLRVKIFATDEVGNWCSEESEDNFTVDMQTPEIDISDIQVNSGNAATDTGDTQPADAGDGKNKPTGQSGEAGKERGIENVKTGNQTVPDYMLEADKAYARGIAFRATKQYDKARTMFERALEIDDRNHEAWYEIGYIYLKQGDLENARDYIERAILFERNPIYYAGLGKIYFQQQDWANALINLHKVSELAPMKAGSIALDAKWYINVIYTRQQDYISASRILEELIRIDDPPSHYRGPAKKRLAQFEKLAQKQQEKLEQETIE
ncbi:tetratricopeptide repeat protein [Planctomycetota bacterium]